MDMTADQLRDTLRSNVKQRRQELGFTQAAAASRAGLTQAFWAQIEAGQRSPRLDILADIATALNTTPDAILSPDVFLANPG